MPLIDILKEALLRTGVLDQVASVAGGGSLKPEVLAERLMLAIYGYGANTGTARSSRRAGRTTRRTCGMCAGAT